MQERLFVFSARCYA